MAGLMIGLNLYVFADLKSTDNNEEMMSLQ